ncbi:MAG: hypothetical protein DU429_07705 [Candidatus Tokpelaia sp.]|nr:MAG: hypothetical protein DU429_07705 [Candidatus Tokpelaia sp.]KAA6206293.1 MAG: hypothetical protein DU430_01890 [Candidatus Tokpelaia sp.]
MLVALGKKLMSKSLFAEKEEGVQFSFWLEGDEQAEYRLTAFKVEEALFSLTKIEVLLNLSSSTFVSADRLGKRASLQIKAEGLAVPACFSGFIAEVTEFFEAGNVLTRFILLPELAKLEKEPRYRVFQDLTVPDIVETILCEHGIVNALWQLEGEFAPRSFCMQYGESDLAFMHRILAEEDIFYYFIHEDKGRQRPVLCNNISLLLDCPNRSSLKHDSHGSHGLYDIAGAEEIYCHSLRRSFGTQMPRQMSQADFLHQSGQNRPAQPAGSFAGAADISGGAMLSGIAHLPLPLCGHKLSLQCPFDKSLNAIWYLTAVRHEGLGADGSRLTRDLADYFAEGGASISAAYAEKTAVNGAYGRAFGATSLLPRLCQVNGGPVCEDEAAGFSAYGVPYNKAVSNVVSMPGSAHTRQNKAQTGHKAVYACAFTALAGSARYRPPMTMRPVIAGPQAAQIVEVDKRARRYRLALLISAFGRRQAEEVCFWADADSSLGAAVAATASGTEAADIGAAPAANELILEFLGGNPDKPIVLQRNNAGAMTGRAESAEPAGGDLAAQNGAALAFDEADFEEQVKHVLADMPWNRAENRAAAKPAGATAEISPPVPHYAGQSVSRGLYAQAAGPQDFIHISPAHRLNTGNPAGGPAAALPAGSGVRMPALPRGAAIPLAHLRADLQNSTAPGQSWAAPGFELDKHNFTGNQQGETAVNSRFLQVGEHQREDIHGIYELNCGEKYLCRTKAVNINAADRLVVRGPGGKIIIDKHSMTLEAPIIRLKGRLLVEEDAFDRQEGIKIAIRDELPLVTECRNAAGAHETDSGTGS